MFKIAHKAMEKDELVRLGGGMSSMKDELQTQMRARDGVTAQARIAAEAAFRL
jgi:Asp/Glu/hydantoin racemase